MPSGSVDDIQKALSKNVFHYAQDCKKAAGRALGTLVEIITFYMLKTWGLSQHIAIERQMPEYSNEDITHNVEYSLHPSVHIADLDFSMDDLPLTVAKMLRELRRLKLIADSGGEQTSNQLLTRGLILRNACTLINDNGYFIIANATHHSKKTFTVSFHQLMRWPFAIAECKRVGVEEGTRKGPTTIEKAKQGAYVARSVSSLQKVRLPDGNLGGIHIGPDGKMACKSYSEFLREVIASTDKELLRRFVMTVGIVSNHGNWFTSENHNKELRVLAQSYDWLLFLTDQGLAQFINDLILNPSSDYKVAKTAFSKSYKGKSGKNQFTKVQMSCAADKALQQYFAVNSSKIYQWFNVISPRGAGLNELKQELKLLCKKDWEKIHS